MGRIGLSILTGARIKGQALDRPAEGIASQDYDWQTVSKKACSNKRTTNHMNWMTQRERKRASQQPAGTTVVSAMLLVTLTAIGQASFAAPDAPREKRVSAMEREERFMGDRAQNRVRINNQSAIQIVKRKFSDHRILNARLESARGKPRYQIKVLSAEGVVNMIYVDAQTGVISD